MINKNEPNFQSQCCCFSMFRKKEGDQQVQFLGSFRQNKTKIRILPEKYENVPLHQTSGSILKT